MVKRVISAELEKGFMSRPIAMLVQVAGNFSSSIYLETNTKRINAKSIMGMMSLAFPLDEEISISADGEDEIEAVEGIERYLAS